MKHNLRVLIAENDEATLSLLTQILREENAQFVKAKTGDRAFLALDGTRFDLCVFNANLDDISGFELLKITREQWPQSTVVIVSDTYSEEDMKKAIHGGAGQYLTKPISPSYFRKLMFNLQEQKEVQENGSKIDKRIFHRKNIRRPVSFIVNLTTQDETGHKYLSSKWFLKGIIVNRSREGLGLITSFPLDKDQLLMLEESANDEAGIVQWRSRVDEQTFMVGVKLV